MASATITRYPDSLDSGPGNRIESRCTMCFRNVIPPATFSVLPRDDDPSRSKIDCTFFSRAAAILRRITYSTAAMPESPPPTSMRCRTDAASAAGEPNRCEMPLRTEAVFPILNELFRHRDYYYYYLYEAKLITI